MEDGAQPSAHARGVLQAAGLAERPFDTILDKVIGGCRMSQQRCRIPAQCRHPGRLEAAANSSWWTVTGTPHKWSIRPGTRSHSLRPLCKNPGERPGRGRRARLGGNNTGCFDPGLSPGQIRASVQAVLPFQDGGSRRIIPAKPARIANAVHFLPDPMQPLAQRARSSHQGIIFIKYNKIGPMTRDFPGAASAKKRRFKFVAREYPCGPKRL